MACDNAFLPDWTDPAAYAPLAAADPAVFAWEWLRRIPAYRAAHARGRRDCRAAARAWGLHRFEDPALAAPLARPIWTAAVHASVLLAQARGTTVPLAALPDALEAFLSGQYEGGTGRLLLSDGWRTIRVDMVPRPRAACAAPLVFSVPGPPALTASVLALRRFDALVRRGHFDASLHPPVPRAARLLRVLRAADALAAGAQQREIAAVLLRGDVRGPRWREENPHLRLQAQRLVRDARDYLAGGYRTLL